MSRGMRYGFGELDLCTDTRRLVADGDVVHVEPQVFDVLAALITERHRVIPKEELLDLVWGSRFVSESALTSRIKAARAAVGDDGRTQRVIRTVHGTGYQFVAEVTERAPASPGAGRSTRLPATAGALYGRARELEDLDALTRDHRLVTILGAGGMGKTRLSVELGRQVDNAVFVDLAAVRDEDALGDALALAIGVEAGAADDVTTACTNYLSGRRTFLIIDNCEHVADAAGRLVTRILADVDDIRLLATSRVPLEHREEVIFRLAPLPLLILTDDQPTPELAAQNAAIALFCDRARRVQHDFDLHPDVVGPVATLCAALDGMPLAIELAAGRLGTFGVADLVERLDRRLDLLGSQRSTGDDRHRTLRTTLNWSYELLPPACQRLFRFMSVYPAGLPVDGVEWLATQIDLDSDALQALNGLVESSLLLRRETPSGTRYPMLETMRTFGIDLLTTAGELEVAEELTVRRALDVTETMREERRAREREWNEQIRQELANLREARAVMHRAGRHGDLLAISVNLNDWGRMRNVSELWSWCDELDPDMFRGVDRARVQAVRSQAAWRRGRIEESAMRAEAALAEDGLDDWVLAASLSDLATAMLFRGELADAGRMWRARVDVDGDVHDLANVALTQAYAGDPDGARTAMEVLLAEIRSNDHPLGEAWGCYVLGEVARIRHDPDTIELLTRAVELAEEVGASFVAGVAGVTLCTAMDSAGDRVGAAHRCSGLVDHWLRAGGWTQLWTTLRNASVFLHDHDPTLAAALLIAADADPDAPGVDDATADATDAYRDTLLERADQARLDGLLALDRARLADTARQVLAAV